MRKVCNLRGSLEGFALDVLESLLILVEMADHITRSDRNEDLNPGFEHALRLRWTNENPAKHVYDSCPLQKELTATTHYLNSYLFVSFPCPLGFFYLFRKLLFPVGTHCRSCPSFLYGLVS